jgi:hypothetical protein
MALGECEFIRTYVNFAGFRQGQLKRCTAAILMFLPTAFTFHGSMEPGGKIFAHKEKAVRLFMNDSHWVC